jgi:hypothetical protein
MGCVSIFSSGMSRGFCQKLLAIARRCILFTSLAEQILYLSERSSVCFGYLEKGIYFKHEFKNFYHHIQLRNWRVIEARTKTKLVVSWTVPADKKDSLFENKIVKCCKYKFYNFYSSTYDIKREFSRRAFTAKLISNKRTLYRLNRWIKVLHFLISYKYPLVLTQ